jgi:hypothetical protein
MQKLWEISVEVIATEAEMHEIKARIAATICEDPHHNGPCKTPWILTSVDEESLDPEDVQNWKEAILDNGARH